MTKVGSDVVAVNSLKLCCVKSSAITIMNTALNTKLFLTFWYCVIDTSHFTLTIEKYYYSFPLSLNAEYPGGLCHQVLNLEKLFSSPN